MPAVASFSILTDLMSEDQVTPYAAYVKSAENIADAFTRSDKFLALKKKLRFNLAQPKEVEELLRDLERRIRKKQEEFDLRREEARLVLLQSKKKNRWTQEEKRAHPKAEKV